MMKLKSLANKKIAILGLGIENQALVAWLIKHKVKCEITICDARESIKNKLPVLWQLGKNYNKDLKKFDILFRSPGWPLSDLKSPLPPLIKGVITSPMKLFFELCPTKNIIGVTGTKGKGTTASLIYEILRAAGKRAWLGGNIGVAPFEFLDKIKKNDWVVLELSSFQLEDMAASPHISVITNLYPEHLAAADPNNPNFHASQKDYIKAKWNIVRWQRKNDYSIFNFKFLISKQFPIFNFQTKSKIIYFKKSDLPSKLIGEHNKENVAAAVEAAKIAGVNEAIIKKAVAGFKGLPHRLELVKTVKGVKYYDDSFATTPESTLIALKSFSVPVVLLLGGADKGSNFHELALEAKKRAKFAVLFKGDATHRIKKELLKAGFKDMKLVFSMKQAIAAAKDEAVPGDVVLLSTACASFGLFKNYKERGNMFKSEVKKL